MDAQAPRYIMIGGFLGAGKTTSILKLAKWLTEERGLRVGLITNDQAEGLVDTTLARDARFVTEEIAGGCFCCRSGSLVEAAERLTNTVKPDVFIAEPVGSCTDLIATVSVPLAKLYKKNYAIAPLSVLVDPFRALRVLSNSPVSSDPSRGFSEDVNYIYLKQLEEAEIIVVNKCDVISQARIDGLCLQLTERFPAAEVICVSARAERGLLDWWTKLMDRTLNVERFMEVDYARYAVGEALLGWVNAAYEIAPVNGGADAVSGGGAHRTPSGHGNGFDGNHFLISLAEQVSSALRVRNVEIAHLKMTLNGVLSSSVDPINRVEERSGQSSLGLAAIQWVRSDAEPEFTRRLSDTILSGSLVVNMRAEEDPTILKQVLNDAIAKSGLNLQVEQTATQAFRPAPPQPTHRVSSTELI